MERRIQAAVRLMAPCSSLIPTARALQICTVFRALSGRQFLSMFTLTPTAMERIRWPVWFYRETHCTEQQQKEVQAYTATLTPLVERYLPSTPMAPVLQTCIVLTAATARIRSPVWFCRGAHYMG